MTTWTVEHRVYAVEQYFRNDSTKTVQRLFRRHFKVKRQGPIPSRNTILRWVDVFRTTGSVMKRNSPGRPVSVRTSGTVETVREAVTSSPTRSARQQSQALGISRRSLHRILDDLHFHPYKLAVVQTLTEGDSIQRRKFCQEMLDILANDDNAMVMMSDEAHFHLDGFVNKQNYRYWAPTNPRQLHQRPLHSLKVTVWSGVFSEGIIGPYFFEDAGSTVTVTSARYVEMLNTFLGPELQRRGVEVSQLWFQQDGATAHTARMSMKRVQEMFPRRAISRFGDVHWPARSPDLSVCDFFLWGHLKDRVYRSKPRTTEELKQSIQHEIQTVPLEMIRRAMQNFRQRLELCIQNEGQHLSDVVFHT